MQQSDYEGKGLTGTLTERARKSGSDGTAAVTALNLWCHKEHSSLHLKKLWNYQKRPGCGSFLPLSSYWCKKRPHCLGCFLAALHLSNHLARRFAKVVNSRVTRNRWAGSSGADSRGLTIVQTQLILKSCWNEFSSTIWLSFDKECKGASTQLLIKREHYSPGTEWHGQITVIYC